MARAPLEIPLLGETGEISFPWRDYFNQMESYSFLGLKRLNSDSTATLQIPDARKYSKIVFELFDVVRSTSTTVLLRTSADGGANVASSSGNYRWAIDYLSGAAAASTTANSSSTGTSIQLSGTNSTSPISGRIELYSADSASTKPLFVYDTICAQTYPERVRGSGMRDSAAAINAVQFLPGSGNFTSGAILAYGVKRQI